MEVRLVLAQRLLQADVRTLCLHAEAGAQQRNMRTDAQQRHIGAACKGQSVVLILQQNSALHCLLVTQINCLLDQGMRVAGSVRIQNFSRGSELVIKRVVSGIFRDELFTLGAKVGVDRRFIAFQDRACHTGQGEHKGKQRRKTAPKRFSFSHGFLLFFLCCPYPATPDSRFPVLTPPLDSISSKCKTGTQTQFALFDLVFTSL